MMKKLLFVALSLLSVNTSFALEKSFLLIKPFREGYLIVRPELAYNAKTGAAWVDLKTSSSFEEPGELDVTEQGIDNLYYNPQTKEIVYDDGDLVVVCAKVITKGKFIFKTKKLEETGYCWLDKVYITKEIGDYREANQYDYEYHYFVVSDQLQK